MERTIKTLAQWNASQDDLGEFLQIGDQVDAGIFLHMRDVLPPQWHAPALHGLLLQFGEPDHHLRGVPYYLTFRRLLDDFYYLGALPAFSDGHAD